MLYKGFAALMVAASLSACAQTDTHVETKDINPYPFELETPMSDALACLSKFDAGDVRIGVANVDDLTGAYDVDGRGAFITRGGAYILMSAFDKVGIRQVLRSNVKVLEWERTKSMAKSLGDGEKTIVDGEEVFHRVAKYGDILGSTRIVFGAFTAIDFNLASGGLQASINGRALGYRNYKLAASFVLATADSVTSEIKFVEKYAKSFEGSEFKAGVFDFLSGNLVDANAGYETHHPMQFGLQYVLEYAAYDYSKELLNAGTLCDDKLPEVYAEAQSNGE